MLCECRFVRSWNCNEPDLPVQLLQQRSRLLHFEDNTFPEQNDFVCDCFEIRYNMLGHYSAGFTLDTYAHVTTDAQLKAAQTMGNILSRAV